MVLVNARCSSCDALLACVRNAWASITKRFILPLYNPENGASFLVRLSGTVRSGTSSTFIENCQVQDIECSSCSRQLGIKCISAPTSHPVMAKGRVVFDKSCVRLRATTNSRREIEPIVERDLVSRAQSSTQKSNFKRYSSERFPIFDTFKFRGFDSFGDSGSFWDPFATAAGDQASQVAKLKNDVAIQKTDVRKIMTEAPKIVSQLEHSLARMSKKVRWLEDTLLEVRKRDDQRRQEIQVLKLELAATKQAENVPQSKPRMQLDSAELQMELSCVQQELRAVIEDNKQLRKDYSELRSERNNDKAGAEDYASEVTGLRREMRQLKAALAKQWKPSSRRRTSGDTSLSFLDSNLQRKRSLDGIEDDQQTPKRRILDSGNPWMHADNTGPSIPLNLPSEHALADISPSKSIPSIQTEDGDEMELVQCP